MLSPTEVKTRLNQNLKHLYMPRMRECYEEQAEMARRESMSHEHYLFELTEREVESRRQNRITRMLRESKLALEKSWESFDTGRIHNNIATSILSPPVHGSRWPPRALPWPEVRKILRGIDRSAPDGKRDYALLLLMSIYGLGAAEALGLRLTDVDWRAGRLRIVRPKTGVETVLPLLPGVARALVSYLRHGRPRHSKSDTVFVTMCAPHQKLCGASAVRHLLIKHARAAGITATFLGSHALRHSNACRQIDLEASPKVLGDILGHRSPASTSAYVRVALKRLRTIGLRVPR